MTALRFRIGTDWWVYDKLIIQARDSSELIGLIEPISFGALWISGFFGLWGYEFLCLLQAGLLYGAFRVLRNSSSRFLGMVIYVGLFMIPSFDVVRQSFAVSVFVILYLSSRSKPNYLNSFKVIFCHYSGILFLLIRSLTNKLTRLNSGISAFFSLVPFIVYGAIGTRAVLLESKYGVFSVVEPHLPLNFVLLLSVAMIYNDRKVHAFLLSFAIFFSFNIDLFNRILFWIWPLMFMVSTNSVYRVPKSVLVLLVLVIFFRNNFNSEVRPFREWNGVWLAKEHQDLRQAQKQWEKLMVAQ